MIFMDSLHAVSLQIAEATQSLLAVQQSMDAFQ